MGTQNFIEIMNYTGLSLQDRQEISFRICGIQKDIVSLRDLLSYHFHNILPCKVK